MHIGIDERAVGVKAGLDAYRRLSSDCADFYVLESMHNELFPWNGDARWKKGMYPIGFDRALGLYDKRHELRAYSVKNTLETREQKLAKEFVTYLSLACGGELRHIKRFLGSQTVTKNVHCLHKHVSTLCCTHEELHWGELHILPICGCLSRHKHGVDFACMLEHPIGCEYDCCGHRCSDDNGCITIEKSYEPSTRVVKYLQTMKKVAHDDHERATGWAQWRRLSKRSLVAWMEECAAAFKAPIWSSGGGGGYGGPRWGTAAELVVSYLRADITARTFLDRCWSLQHNGGCIFNKFYQMHRDASSSTDSLMSVLVIQSNNDYKSLATSYCSPYVRELWDSHERAMGRRTIFDVMENTRKLGRPASATAKSTIQAGNWPFTGSQQGCNACWLAKLKWDGSPCGGEGAGTLNDACGYYSDYLESWNETLNPDGGDMGCIACFYHAFSNDTTDGDPCGAGSQIATASCAYYNEYMQAIGAEVMPIDTDDEEYEDEEDDDNGQF